MYNMRSVFKIAKQEGFFGLYRGWSISVFCIPVFNTIYFPVYDMIKTRLKKDYAFEEDSVSFYSLSAGLAGCVTNTITNPFWMLRTRM